MDVPKSAVDINPRIHMNGDSRFINGVVSSDAGIIILLNVDTFIIEENIDMVSGF